MQRDARPDDTGAMGQHHREGDVLLAGLLELRPIPGHRSVQVEFAAVGRQVDARARQALGAGIDAGQGIFAPWPQARSVGVAAPQIDGEIAVHRDRDRRADVVAVGEIGFERVAHPLKAGRAGTVDRDRGPDEQGSSCAVKAPFRAGDGNRTRVASLEAFYPRCAATQSPLVRGPHYRP
jgi:hypothetical protein